MRFKRNLVDFATEVIPNHNRDNYMCQRWVPSPLMTTKVVGGGSRSQPSRIHKAGRRRPGWGRRRHVKQHIMQLGLRTGAAKRLSSARDPFVFPYFSIYSHIESTYNMHIAYNNNHSIHCINQTEIK